MMKNFNILALRVKINNVAQRGWLRLRLFDQLFQTLCVMKTKMLSSLDIFRSLATEIKRKFHDSFHNRMLAIFETGVLFWDTLQVVDELILTI